MDSILSSISGPEAVRGLETDQLLALADEVRNVIKQTVSRNGGHLASNLGVVELTIALHHVFDMGHDRVCWDVGHQCYVHKLLTGRADRFETLRQANGISGFPNPGESQTDQFAVGHAGSAIASAVGLAVGAQQQGHGESVVAVVGDGSIVNGMSFEGLNNTSLLKRQLLIILNDNSMAIDPSEGAFADYLMQLRTSRSYEDLQRRTRLLVKRLPFGDAIHETLEHIKAGIKTTIQHRQIFEQLGIPYFGPIDGHDLPSLVRILGHLRDFEHPALLHIHTEKGRGFEPASKDPRAFHSPKPFELEGETVNFINETGGRSFTAAFASALQDEMEQDEGVIALTAAMPSGTGLSELRKSFPERVVDVGIAESAAVAIASGAAKTGLKPVVAIYSTFLQRGFDQVFQEVALQKLPVVFCVDRAGMVGSDGPTHHGFCDIALFRTLPGMVLMAPADESEMGEALRFALQSEAPCVIRYPRDVVPPADTFPRDGAFELGKARCVREGSDVALLCYGEMTWRGLQAGEALAEQGIDAGVYQGRFAKPVDTALLTDLLSPGRDTMVVTVEDHVLAGGFGSAVLEAAEQAGLDTRRIHRLGLPDRFIEHASRSAQLAEAGLDVAGIIRSVQQALTTITAHS